MGAFAYWVEKSECGWKLIRLVLGLWRLKGNRNANPEVILKEAVSMVTGEELVYYCSSHVAFSLRY